MTDFPYPVLTWLGAEWKYVLALLCIGGCAFWMWRRTRSTHVFTAILWRRLFGEPAQSSALSTFFEDRSELMRFRAMTGLYRTPTAAAAQRIATWATEHQLDIDLVAAAGPGSICTSQASKASRPR